MKFWFPIFLNILTVFLFLTVFTGFPAYNDGIQEIELKITEPVK